MTVLRTCVVALLVVLGPLSAQAGEVTLAYLKRPPPRPPVLATVDVAPPDEGLQGVRLGVADNATTGRFLGQTFTLTEAVLPEDGDIAAALARLHAAGQRLVVLDLDASGLDAALAAPAAADMLLFNVGAPDDRFRGADCRSNLLHVLPSRAMAADAVAQTLVAKRWREWFLVTGPRPEDALFADALRRAAHRFGAEIVAEKAWTGDHDLRRSAPAEVAQFTQGPDYDVLIVADEAGDFGDYLPYNTHLPRPVAGTQGLVPTAWHWSLERWGAGQLQSRFESLSGRRMRAGDYTAWLAARIIGEAAARTNATDAATLAAHITGPEMDVAAFKGRPLTFRAWNGQLRQPIPLVWPRSLVTLAPQEGFLHPITDLDTLGWDNPESRCKESMR